MVIKLASRLLCGEESDVEYLLNEARRKKFTHQGEMFSGEQSLYSTVTNILKLVFLGGKSSNLLCQLHKNIHP